MPRDSNVSSGDADANPTVQRSALNIVDELKEIDRRSIRPLRELMIGQREALRILIDLDARASLLREELYDILSGGKS